MHEQKVIKNFKTYTNAHTTKAHQTNKRPNEKEWMYQKPRISYNFQPLYIWIRIKLVTNLATQLQP